eukprot:GHVQ01029183.1.p1 GENE.GHVQ01029183.1~~GHVQ01029183.1.p1  ORF type:complete len:506 (+),score=36.91 GHVQ01029183.1:259-1776(+)
MDQASSLSARKGRELQGSVLHAPSSSLLSTSCRVPQNTLIYSGISHFRTRIVLATIAGCPILIKAIRRHHGEAGLRRHEVSLLRLLDKITEGSVVEIDETGSELFYWPGTIVGGDTSQSAGGANGVPIVSGECSETGVSYSHVHNCGKEVCVSYFIEALMMVAPFGKFPLDILLQGLTHDGMRPPVDIVRTVSLPLLKRVIQAGQDTAAFCTDIKGQDVDNDTEGIQGRWGTNADMKNAKKKKGGACSTVVGNTLVWNPDGLMLKIESRGCPPLGGGRVRFQCPILSRVNPFVMIDEGKVKRVRGVAFCSKVAGQYAVRMGDRARGLLNPLLKDVFIYTEMDGRKAGRGRKNQGGYGGLSEGYGITLVAETSTGVCKGADMCIDARVSRDVHSLPFVLSILNGGESKQRRQPCKRMRMQKEGGAHAVGGEGIRCVGQELIMPGGKIENIIKRTSISTEEQRPGVAHSACEWVGRACASRLLLEVSQGGVVDSSHQYLPLFFYGTG